MEWIKIVYLRNKNCNLICRHGGLVVLLRFWRKNMIFLDGSCVYNSGFNSDTFIGFYRSLNYN